MEDLFRARTIDPSLYTVERTGKVCCVKTKMLPKACHATLMRYNNALVKKLETFTTTKIIFPTLRDKSNTVEITGKWNDVYSILELFYDIITENLDGDLPKGVSIPMICDISAKEIEDLVEQFCDNIKLVGKCTCTHHKPGEKHHHDYDDDDDDDDDDDESDFGSNSDDIISDSSWVTEDDDGEDEDENKDEDVKREISEFAERIGHFFAGVSVDTSMKSNIESMIMESVVTSCFNSKADKNKSHKGVMPKLPAKTLEGITKSIFKEASRVHNDRIAKGDFKKAPSKGTNKSQPVNVSKEKPAKSAKEAAQPIVSKNDDTESVGESERKKKKRRRRNKTVSSCHSDSSNQLNDLPLPANKLEPAGRNRTTSDSNCDKLKKQNPTVTNLKNASKTISTSNPDLAKDSSKSRKNRTVSNSEPNTKNSQSEPKSNDRKLNKNSKDGAAAGGSNSDLKSASHSGSANDKSKSGSTSNTKSGAGDSSDNTFLKFLSEGGKAEVSKLKVFQNYLKAGSEALIADDFSKALSNYKLAKDASKNLPKNQSLSGIKSVVFGYAQCAAYIKTSSYDNIVLAISELKSVPESMLYRFPAIKFLTAVACHKLNRFKIAEEILNELHTLLEKGAIVESFLYPGTEITIPETKLDFLMSETKKLESDCRLSQHNAVAVCKFENCTELSSHIYPSKYIYSSDPDFAGYIVVVCQEKCDVEYHINCWKAYKESKVSQPGKVTDKDFLGQPCPTMDCILCDGSSSPIIKIDIYDVKGAIKHSTAMDISKIKVPEKKKPEKLVEKPEKTEKTEKPKLAEKRPPKIVPEDLSKPKIKVVTPSKKLPPPEQQSRGSTANKTKVTPQKLLSSLENTESKKLSDEEEFILCLDRLEALRVMWQSQHYTDPSVAQYSDPSDDFPTEFTEPESESAGVKTFIRSMFQEMLINEGYQSVGDVEKKWMCNEEFREVRQMLKDSERISDILLESKDFFIIEDILALQFQLPDVYTQVKTVTVETLKFLHSGLFKPKVDVTKKETKNSDPFRFLPPLNDPYPLISQSPIDDPFRFLPPLDEPYATKKHINQQVDKAREKLAVQSHAAENKAGPKNLKLDTAQQTLKTVEKPKLKTEITSVPSLSKTHSNAEKPIKQAEAASKLLAAVSHAAENEACSKSLELGKPQATLKAIEKPKVKTEFTVVPPVNKSHSNNEKLVKQTEEASKILSAQSHLAENKVGSISLELGKAQAALKTVEKPKLQIEVTVVPPLDKLLSNSEKVIKQTKEVSETFAQSSVAGNELASKNLKPNNMVIPKGVEQSLLSTECRMVDDDASATSSIPQKSAVIDASSYPPKVLPDNHIKSGSNPRSQDIISSVIETNSVPSKTQNPSNAASATETLPSKPNPLKNLSSSLMQSVSQIYQQVKSNQSEVDIPQPISNLELTINANNSQEVNSNLDCNSITEDSTLPAEYELANENMSYVSVDDITSIPDFEDSHTTEASDEDLISQESLIEIEEDCVQDHGDQVVSDEYPAEDTYKNLVSSCFSENTLIDYNLSSSTVACSDKSEATEANINVKREDEVAEAFIETDSSADSKNRSKTAVIKNYNSQTEQLGGGECEEFYDCDQSYKGEQIESLVEKNTQSNVESVSVDSTECLLSSGKESSIHLDDNLSVGSNKSVVLSNVNFVQSRNNSSIFAILNEIEPILSFIQEFNETNEIDFKLLHRLVNSFLSKFNIDELKKISSEEDDDKAVLKKKVKLCLNVIKDVYGVFIRKMTDSLGTVHSFGGTFIKRCSCLEINFEPDIRSRDFTRSPSQLSWDSFRFETTSSRGSTLKGSCIETSDSGSQTDSVNFKDGSDIEMSNSGSQTDLVTNLQETHVQTEMWKPEPLDDEGKERLLLFNHVRNQNSIIIDFCQKFSPVMPKFIADNLADMKAGNGRFQLASKDQQNMLALNDILIRAIIVAFDSSHKKYKHTLETVLTDLRENQMSHVFKNLRERYSDKINDLESFLQKFCTNSTRELNCWAQMQSSIEQFSKILHQVDYKENVFKLKHQMLMSKLAENGAINENDVKELFEMDLDSDPEFCLKVATIEEVFVSLLKAAAGEFQKQNQQILFKAILQAKGASAISPELFAQLLTQQNSTNKTTVQPIHPNVPVPGSASESQVSFHADDQSSSSSGHVAPDEHKNRNIPFEAEISQPALFSDLSNDIQISDGSQSNGCDHNRRINESQMQETESDFNTKNHLSVNNNLLLSTDDKKKIQGALTPEFVSLSSDSNSKAEFKEPQDIFMRKSCSEAPNFTPEIISSKETIIPESSWAEVDFSENKPGSVPEIVAAADIRSSESEIRPLLRAPIDIVSPKPDDVGKFKVPTDVITSKSENVSEFNVPVVSGLKERKTASVGASCSIKSSLENLCNLMGKVSDEKLPQNPVNHKKLEKPPVSYPRPLIGGPSVTASKSASLQSSLKNLSELMGKVSVEKLDKNQVDLKKLEVPFRDTTSANSKSNPVPILKKVDKNQVDLIKLEVPFRDTTSTTSKSNPVPILKKVDKNQVDLKKLEVPFRDTTSTTSNSNPVPILINSPIKSKSNEPKDPPKSPAKAVSNQKPVSSGALQKVSTACLTSQKKKAEEKVVKKPEPPTGSKNQSKFMSSLKNSCFKKLMQKLHSKFPSKNDVELILLLRSVREMNSSSLSGLPYDEILALIDSIVDSPIFKFPKLSGNGAATATKPSTSSMGLEKFGQSAWVKNEVSDNANYSNEDLKECCICCCKMVKNSTTTLECKHLFHTHCIREWLKHKCVCPLCQKFCRMPDEYPSLR